MVDVPGVVARGALVVVHADDISRDAAHQMKAMLAGQVGHDEFGLLFTGRDVAVEVLDRDDLRSLGWVYVGTPGVCPSCGGTDVVLTTGDDAVARRCGSCGHRWVHYHSGRAA